MTYTSFLLSVIMNKLIKINFPDAAVVKNTGDGTKNIIHESKSI